MSGQAGARALAGIRVLELTTAVAGPVAAHILGDMGAEVIKIEQPSARSATVTAPPPREGAPDRPYNRIPTFNELNRSKRHLPLDLGRPEGKAILLRLAAISDVVIENFSPRVVGNLGVDYAVVREVNPSIIYVSMPAFGKTGPYATLASYGPGIDAMSGLSHLTGYPDRGPGKPANYFCDQNSALLAVFSTLAALRHLRLTGEGQYIENSMLDGELQAVAPALMDASLNGRAQTRTGNRHAWMAPHGVYRCAGEDEWVAIAVTDDERWRALCRVIERDDLAGDSALAELAGRVERHDELDAAIEAWTATREPREVERLLQAAGVAAGAVLDIAQATDDPQLLHRETLVSVEHPEMGTIRHTRTAWRSRRGNHGVASPAPLFGDAIDHALGGLLALSEAEVARLLDEGVVARSPAQPGR